MFRLTRIAPIALLAVSTAAAAHSRDAQESAAWTFAPAIVLPLALVLFVYLAGRRRLEKRSRVARGSPWLFLTGWGTLVLALVSPLHSGGERSFTVHMAEHEVIMLIATLLLAASHSGGILAWGLPAPVRKILAGSWRSPLSSLWRRMTEPVTATIVQAVVMWVWHAPSLFDRALDNDGWHAAQHLSFIVASLAFWSAMLDPRRGGYLVSAICLFVTSLVEGALGALMSLSHSPWYEAYAAMGLSGIGLDPVTDQQLAGLLMWIPGGLVHGAAALVLLYRWLQTHEDRHAVGLE